jgi:DNA-binding NarL/FixJ family response regulator
VPLGLSEREVEVLRLLADGAETSEIARKLTYSESTIKHVQHTLSTRSKFRNRVHAVAFALRAGVL